MLISVERLKQARVPPRLRGGLRRECALTQRVARYSGEWREKSGQWSVSSEAEGRELAVREKRRTKPTGGQGFLGLTPPGYEPAPLTGLGIAPALRRISGATEGFRNGR